MSNNNDEKLNNQSEKKNFTDILADKAEKAGEATADAVQHFIEMLTSKDKESVELAKEQAASAKDSETEPSIAKKEEAVKKSTEKLVSSVNESLNVKKDNFDKSNNESKKEKQCTWKMTLVNCLLVIYDVFAVVLSYFLALWFRFDCAFTQIPREYLTPFIEFIPIYIIICFATFVLLKLYKSLWRYASVIEAVRVITATAVTGVLHIILITAFFKRMPISYYFFGPLFQGIFILGIRYMYRLYLIIRKRYARNYSSMKRVMIIGAGEAGRSVIREIQRSEEMHEIPVCVIDKDQTKWHKQIEGVPIVGGRESILLNAEKYNVQKIYYAIPSSDKKTQRDVLSICSETHCELKILPGIYQIANGDVDIKAMKDVAIEDLLGREPIKVDMQEIYDQIVDKVVLITGGGGSIGSEIALQVSRHNPKKLIIFDIYENNAYAIQHKILRENPECPLEVMIGSVRDSRRVNDIFRRFRPDIVYHAAAHKHVPLMEDSPCEAIKNNVIGTYKVAYAAMMYGTHRFVLISTDKAVNPTNIMGASKRLCELVVQSFDKMIKNKREADIPVLHVHQEDEDGSMYPLVEGTQRFDKNGEKIFTLPGQDNEGHRKAQTEYSMVRFGDSGIIGQTYANPHKYCILRMAPGSIMLYDLKLYDSSMEEKHTVSIPSLDPIVINIIKVSTKMLLVFLRLARVMGDMCRMISCDEFGLLNNSKYKQFHSNGLAPLLI